MLRREAYPFCNVMIILLSLVLTTLSHVRVSADGALKAWKKWLRSKRGMRLPD